MTWLAGPTYWTCTDAVDHILKTRTQTDAGRKGD